MRFSSAFYSLLIITFYTQISIPFVTSYALKTLQNLKSKKLKKGIVSALILFFIIETSIFLKDYFIEYPKYSADFWGWQDGPKKIVKYFSSQRNNYDQLYMTGYFNQPQSLLNFYNFDNKCANCKIGSPNNNFNPDLRQLFVIRENEIANVEIDFTIKGRINLTNGKPEYFIIEPLL